jgi:hypothetical protein
MSESHTPRPSQDLIPASSTQVTRSETTFGRTQRSLTILPLVFPACVAALASVSTMPALGREWAEKTGMLMAATLMLEQASEPRYIFVNNAPGVVWDQNRPESITRAMFDDIRDTVRAPENPQLRLGVSFVWSVLQSPPETTAAGVRRFLALSEATGMPVLVNFDVCNWWEQRPDLWNWWDSAKPGYDRKNAENVEWTDWTPDTAVKVCWRNWGSQLRVAPAPNLMSQRVITAQLEGLRPALAVVAAWYRSLPQDRRWLLGGVKLGHEASIGVNAFHYPDGNTYLERYPNDTSHDPTAGFQPDKGWHGGLALLGHAALKSAGIKDSGEVSATDVAEVVRRHLDLLCRAAHDAGLPAPLIYTHQGGTYAPWEKHLPFAPAFQEYANPGWSLYGVDPSRVAPLGQELDKPGRGRWAAVEWWWGASTKEEWLQHFRSALDFRDCRFIDVYNWNCGYELRKEAAGLEALRGLCATWHTTPTQTSRTPSPAP